MQIVNAKGFGLRQQALLAAVRITGGTTGKRFTAEELLVEAWKLDKAAWGLRGFEDAHPDSEKINKELSPGRRKTGLVDQGLVERVGSMVFCLTVAGLHEAVLLQPSDSISREKADRQLEEAVKGILGHRVFREWLTDPAKPKYFREAGHFWGIAAGMPARTVRERIRYVEDILQRAMRTLDHRGIDAVTLQRGQLLFDRNDIERCLEFQELLKKRFERDLGILDPKVDHELIDDSAQQDQTK